MSHRGGPESLLPVVVQAESQGELLPQLQQHWSELFWADIGTQRARTGAAHALLPVAGGESALGRRRGCAGSLGSLRAADSAGAAGVPWPGSEQPGFTAWCSLVVLLDVRGLLVMPHSQGQVKAGHPA